MPYYVSFASDSGKKGTKVCDKEFMNQISKYLNRYILLRQLKSY